MLRNVNCIVLLNTNNNNLKQYDMYKVYTEYNNFCVEYFFINIQDTKKRI